MSEQGERREERALYLKSGSEQSRAATATRGKGREGERERGGEAATAGEGERDAFVKWVRRGKGRRATSGT